MKLIKTPIIFFVLFALLSACASHQAPVFDASTNTAPIANGVDSIGENTNPQQRVISAQSDVEQSGLQGQPLQSEVIPSQELQGQPLISDGSVQAQALPSSRSSPPIVAQLLRQSEEASAQQDWQKAESYLLRALRISPKNGLLWSRMARVKLEQGQNSQAIQFASKSNSISNDLNLKNINNAIISAASR